MAISTGSEYNDPADLETLAENNLIHTDMKDLALLTLYVVYQSRLPEKRAEAIYLCFSKSAFYELHIEDMFSVGREELRETEQFWKDWIELLKSKNGDTEARLLKEAVLYTEGIEGLEKIAEENAALHPSLYLAVMKEYEKGYMYEKIEETGKKALEVLDVNLRIRGEIAIKAAAASSVLKHEENMMKFCFECFRSDSKVKNYLRLFGTDKMEKCYVMQGTEILRNRKQEDNKGYSFRNTEFIKNVIGDEEYLRLCFYTGEFEKVKEASRNPKGSLGWSSSFIKDGIRLFLLYLYEEPLPSRAAAGIAAYIGFSDTKDETDLMTFEKEILEESREHKVSEFWNYFQRWKRYFPMETSDKKQYLKWAEKIVYSRADAIVSGQHRYHYGDAAMLLAVVGEIKESMGEAGAGREIFAEYKRKFPRHSSFQKEMKTYFYRA